MSLINAARHKRNKKKKRKKGTASKREGKRNILGDAVLKINYEQMLNNFIFLQFKVLFIKQIVKTFGSGFSLV